MSTPWYNTENLLTEMRGVNRNVLMAVFAIGFGMWQFFEMLVRMYGGKNPNILLGAAPLAGAIGICYFIIIPRIRDWNDTKPKGHFEGLQDFYLHNPETLEIGNDPEPLPQYIPNGYKKSRPERTAQ